MAELPQIAPAAPPQVPRDIARPTATLGADITQDAGRMQWVVHQAMRDEQAGKMSAAIGQYVLKVADIRQNLAPVRDGNTYVASYKTAAAAARDSVTASLPAGPVRDRVTGEINLHMADDIANHAVPHGAALTVGSAQDSIRSALTTNAMAAVHASDPNDRAYFLNQGVGLIHGFNYWTDGEKQQQEQLFRATVDKMGLQAQIQSDPSAATAELYSPDFAKNHPLITPQEQAQMTSAAATRFGQQNHAVDAQMAAQRGATEDHFMTLAAQGQPVEGPALDTAAAHGLVSPEFYRRYTGHPFQQTMPGVMQAFTSAIKTATSPEDLDAITEHAALAQEAGQMSGRDAAVVSLTAAHAKAALRETGNAQGALGWAQVLNRYDPAVQPVLADPMAPKISIEALHGTYLAQLAAHKGNVQAAVQATITQIDEMKKLAMPGAAAAGGDAARRLVGGK